MKNCFIKGNKISLRPLTLDDIDGGYQSWLNDSEVCSANNYHRFPYTREMLESFILGLSNDRSTMLLAIECNEKSIHIGNIGLSSIDLVNRTGEYGVLIGNKDYWNKGVALEASMLIIKHAFNELNLNRIWCGTLESNIGMRKLAEKIGMKPEGVRKEAIFKSGRYQDVHNFGLLKTDFK